jgi:hypothetical protein
MATFLPYVIPILTFVLGAMLTLFLRRHDKRAAVISAHAKELSDAANEWYNQLHELVMAPEDEFYERSEKYVTNRLVLPRFLRSLAALRGYSQAEPIAKEAERILLLLTNCRSQQRYCCRPLRLDFEPLTDRPPYRGKFLSKDPRRNTTYFSREGFSLDETLGTIDRSIQSISVLSGEVAARGVLRARRVSVLKRGADELEHSESKN